MMTLCCLLMCENYFSNNYEAVFRFICLIFIVLLMQCKQKQDWAKGTFSSCGCLVPEMNGCSQKGTQVYGFLQVKYCYMLHLLYQK